ncbi:MAG: type IV secretion system protein [Alphaproteobacteria bacterium]|nr:type IV secretion system protein [Alphaproteobacteria bacterium]
MSRLTMMFMVVVIAMLGMFTPHTANAGYMANTDYGDPPVPFTPPLTAETGETQPYLYDMSTSLQVTYWSAVIDGIGAKFAIAGDMSGLDTSEKVWDFVARKKIDINQQEAKILCLFMNEDDDPPTDGVIPNFPTWPSCGGVLETMFGPDFIPYLKTNAGDREIVEIYQYLLQSMGIDIKDILPTINERMGSSAGPGPDDLNVDDVAGNRLECYTPANNIRRYDVSGCGILCTVTRVIMGLLNTASEGIVEATANNADFNRAILAALTLYITIYGAMVLLGLVSVALGDAVVRVVKLGFVAMLLTSDTIMTLFHMGRCFFVEGTTYLINAVMQVGLEAVVTLNAGGEIPVGTLYGPAGGADLCGSSFDDATSAQGPLVIFEALVTQIFSPHMGLVILTLFLSGAYGWVIAIFLMVGLVFFVFTLLGAVTLYLTCLIGQYLLLSLLPFFVVFLLFEKTQHLFQGWFNMLLTYSLQPIFLFAYISLFVVVTSAALAQILDVRICWAKWFAVGWVFDLSKWFFYGANGPLVDLPFGFFEVLIFVLLVALMHEFKDHVEQIANDIGNSYVYSNGAGRALEGWFRGKGRAIKAKTYEGVKSGGKKAVNYVRGGAGGHSTASASGQKGVGGSAGGSANVSRKGVGR